MFGDHQDYLGLPVIACAIDKNITLTATVNNTNAFVINMPDTGEERVIPIDATFETLTARDYFASGLRVARRYGCATDQGYTVTISGTIPINAGLSSSSAFVVAWMSFLFHVFGKEKPTPEFIARFAYEAEVVEHNSPGGKMDQFTISMGNIQYIETDADFQCTEIGTSLTGLVIAESGIGKSTLGTLGRLQEATWNAIKRVQEGDPEFILKEASVSDINKYYPFISEDERPYFYAALRNHEITQSALNEFQKPSPDIESLGKLMYAHHEILRDYLGVSIPVIDSMIDAAMRAGAYGAKIVGSGGGGCICALCPADKENEIMNAIEKTEAVAVYPASVEKGAHAY